SGLPPPPGYQIPALRVQTEQQAVGVIEGDSDVDLKRRVQAAVKECLEMVKVRPGVRDFPPVLRKFHIDQNDLKTGKIFQKHLQESLDLGDSIDLVAQKLTLLHDFPAEVGGGGFCSMVKVPNLRKRLLQRLLQELDQSGAEVIAST